MVKLNKVKEEKLKEAKSKKNKNKIIYKKKMLLIIKCINQTSFGRYI